jgi:hypothetical protein
MTTRIFDDLMIYFSKYTDLSPEEISNSGIEQHFTNAYSLLNMIIEEDTQFLQSLSSHFNKSIPLHKTQLPSLINMAFRLIEDQNEINFYFAHWYISKDMLSYLVRNVVTNIIRVRMNYLRYHDSLENTSTKRSAFVTWLREHDQILGLINNIISVIIEYHDLFIDLCKKINPQIEEMPIKSFKSPLSSFQLFGSVWELLLHGRHGRESGFGLIRSAIEIMLARRIFDTTNSIKFKNKAIKFSKHDEPSVTDICNSMESLGLEKMFEKDSVNRLYKWQSKVLHEGHRPDVSLIWFALLYAQQYLSDIYDKHNDSLNMHIDKILEHMQ